MSMVATWIASLGCVFLLFGIGKYLQVLEKQKKLEREQLEQEILTKRAEAALRQPDIFYGMSTAATNPAGVFIETKQAERRRTTR